MDGFALFSAERGAVCGTGVTPAMMSHRRVPGRSASRSCVPPPPPSGGEVWGGSLGNSGAGESPGRLETHLAFLPGLLHLPLPKDLSCKKEGRTQVCFTGPSELAASLTQGLGASKIETTDKNQNFCLKLLGFAFIALPPGMNLFHGS